MSDIEIEIANPDEDIFESVVILKKNLENMDFVVQINVKDISLKDKIKIRSDDIPNKIFNNQEELRDEVILFLKQLQEERGSDILLEVPQEKSVDISGLVIFQHGKYIEEIERALLGTESKEDMLYRKALSEIVEEKIGETLENLKDDISLSVEKKEAIIIETDYINGFVKRLAKEMNNRYSLPVIFYGEDSGEIWIESKQKKEIENMVLHKGASRVGESLYLGDFQRFALSTIRDKFSGEESMLLEIGEKDLDINEILLPYELCSGKREDGNFILCDYEIKEYQKVAANKFMIMVGELNHDHVVTITAKDTVGIENGEPLLVESKDGKYNVKKVLHSFDYKKDSVNSVVVYPINSQEQKNVMRI